MVHNQAGVAPGTAASFISVTTTGDGSSVGYYSPDGTAFRNTGQQYLDIGTGGTGNLTCRVGAGFATAWTTFNSGIFQVSTPAYTAAVTETTAARTVALTDYSITANVAATCTLTLPSAATFSGRVLWVRTIQAQTVVSASSNVVPLAGGSAGTAILAGTAGKWALLQSDGTNWQIIAGA